jgi:hypothetical protein
MAEFDLGRLLRLQEAINASTDTEASGKAAPALSESYMRLRGQAAELVAETQLADEFAATFPEIEVVQGPSGRDPAQAAAFSISAAPQAENALALLRQLGGWVAGIVREMTLEQQMRIEAQEKAKLAAKQPPGFA